MQTSGRAISSLIPSNPQDIPTLYCVHLLMWMLENMQWNVTTAKAVVVVSNSCPGGLQITQARFHMDTLDSIPSRHTEEETFRRLSYSKHLRTDGGGRRPRFLRDLSQKQSQSC